MPTAGRAIKDDDGGAGVGMIVPRVPDRAGPADHPVIGTRWLDGRPLGDDRFRHVQTCICACRDQL
ncbi:MAG: hypothetical protein AAGK77_09475 [Pseudomonadota bacterium]